MTLRTILLSALTLTAALAWDNDRFKEDFRYTYALAANGRLQLETFNGTVEILGWDKNEIEITGTKYGATQEIVKALQVEITNTPNSISIRVPRPPREGDSWGSKGGAKFTIRCPRKVQLDRIASSNGGVRVEMVEGDARIATSNGAIRLASVTGAIDAATSNAAIETQAVKGNLLLRTSNGGIRAEGVEGTFEATTSNGTIRARLAKVPAGTPVRATTSNGTVDLAFDQFSGNDVRVSTSNGSIVVTLPGGANAQVRATTSNANVETDFEVSVRGTISKNRIEGRIGNGGPLLDLTSSNGSIRILKSGAGSL